MKYIVLYVLFTFSGILLAQNNFQQSIDSVITWKSTVRLSWDDFQSKEEPDELARAMTGYKINIIPLEVIVDEQGRIHGYEKLSVKAQFYKNYSWTSSQSLFLLEHEQLHFDIAELYARKIRKRFAELKSAKEARFSIYQDSYSMLWKNCIIYQKQYDIETQHGQKLEINQLWKKRIIGELKELNAFE